jgi:hypothetical protein
VGAGEYRVEFVPPAGRSFTLRHRGANEALDSDASPNSGRTGPFTLGDGESLLTVDAGLIP